jgi:hypothetical protein
MLCCLAVVAATLVPGAGAGNFDEQRMGCTGEDPGICPEGTEGQSYAMPIYLLGDEDLACAVFTLSSGSLPLGLSLNSDGRVISGTPTQAGTFDFFLSVAYTREATCPFKNPSDDPFRIVINPGVPKLTIGPEQSGVPVATVSSPYSLQMTASVPDSKTWTIASGELPAGLTLGATDGLISGTPTTAGTYSFTVRAEVNPQRVDTKSLAITVRDRVAIASAVTPPSEVGVPFLLPLSATGGSGTFAWALSSGALPTGVALTPTGTIAGRPSEAGTFAYTVTASDTEGRTGAYTGTMTVAERIAVVPQRFRPATVGRFYQARLKSTGGIEPATWRIKRGPLPRGFRFDRERGLFYGTPTRARTYRIQVEIQDSLRVRSAATVTLVVKAAKKPKRR